MNRKVFYLVVLAAITSVGANSCCNDASEYKQYNSLQITLTDNRYGEQAISVVTGDTVFMKIRLNGECVAQSLPVIPFVTSAYAFSCTCGESGLKSSAVSLRIYTDNKYATYPAGSDITDLFFTSEGQSVAQAIALINGSEKNFRNGRGWYNFTLGTVTNPADTLPHNFRVQLSFEDTTMTEGTTGMFIWK